MPKSLATLKVFALLGLAIAGGCATVTDQSLVIHNADLAYRLRHEDQVIKARGAGAVGLSFEDRAFAINGHRVITGDGDILALRKEGGGTILATDQAAFSYLTVYLPKGAAEAAHAISFAEPNNGALAFFSRGSLDLPGTTGCLGYALSGTVTVSKLEKGMLRVKLDFPVALVSPLGFREECRQESFHEIRDVKEGTMNELVDRTR